MVKRVLIFKHFTQNGQSGSESDHSDQSSGSVLELNEKLLEAHKKVVQLKLNKEVAKNFHGVSICVDMWAGDCFVV